jgi:hypothetical protein
MLGAPALSQESAGFFYAHRPEGQDLPHKKWEKSPSEPKIRSTAAGQCRTAKRDKANQAVP